jgi:hypothetical protein
MQLPAMISVAAKKLPDAQISAQSFVLFAEKIHAQFRQDLGKYHP